MVNRVFVWGRAVSVLITGAVLLSACARTARPAIKTVAKVPVIAAAPGSVQPASRLGGLIIPFQNVAMQTTLTEPVNSVNVQAGDVVTKGQVLALLDTRDLQATLKADLGTAASDHAKAQSAYLQAGLTITQSSNTINSARASVNQVQATFDKDSVDLQRDASLLKSGYIAQQAYDQQKTLVANDQQAVRSAQVALQNQISQVQTNGSTSSGLQGAAVASTRADEQTALGNADQIRAQIAKATIVSPVNGIVVNRNLNPGEYPGTRQIFTLQEMDKVYAVLSGSGGQIMGVRSGSKAVISSSDRATIKGSGSVVAVLDEVTPGSTNFSVKVLLPNPQGTFHAGMVVTAVVQLPESHGMRVPVSSFVDDTNSSVQTVEGGVVKTVPVVLIAQDGKNAVVTGLQLGQKVIINGQLGLSDGQPVEPIAGRNVAER